MSKSTQSVATRLPRSRRVVALIIMLLPVCFLAACSDPPPPAEPQAAAKDPNANAFEGTVYDAQGKALRKAKEVDQAVLDQAEAQRKAIDEAGG